MQDKDLKFPFLTLLISGEEVVRQAVRRLKTCACDGSADASFDCFPVLVRRLPGGARQLGPAEICAWSLR